TFLNDNDEVVQAGFDEWGLDNVALRGVPVKRVQTASGETAIVTTVYDLIMAQYGVNRGLEGDYPADYDDKDAAYTPAWQEIFTGVD
ncbi:MAG: hypothetical protein QGI84_11625, partial [Dehalococcoidia bacterium]|nr:hypothetical protein [Dehalococcoidia bacterium]